MSRVVVIGAGAAGLMAAWRASYGGAQVLVLERNEKAGKKIYITGKGRCNLTNDCETPEFFDSVVHNPRFLYSAVYGFDHDAVKSFFEDKGCPVKTERGNRVFPVSDHASDVTRALVRALDASGAEVRYECRVSSLITAPDGIRGVRLENGERLEAGSVILATGGLSYPSTGSTGDGYRMAKEAGHRITARTPSLTGFNTVEEWPGELQGLSLKNVRCSLEEVKSGRILKSDFGEMLFTHYGISGPIALTLSAYADTSGNGQYRLMIDLKPAVPGEELAARIKRMLDAAPAAGFGTAVRPLFPSRLSERVVWLSGIAPERRCGTISNAEIRSFAELIKGLSVDIRSKRGYNEAVITQGGVDVREINPSTMESRLVKGLYFAGEIMDVDALTGGYNLQIAWSTGYLAGMSAASG